MVQSVRLLILSTYMLCGKVDFCVTRIGIFSIGALVQPRRFASGRRPR
jgi:hypothetical protein